MRIEHTRLLSGREIATIEYGHSKTADCSVVFLHGWLDNAASFESVMKQLHQTAPDLHLCAVDLPGHGLSDHKSADNFYPFHDYIDDVYKVLLNISPNKLVLVGHSLGALIASCYSAAFPEQVAGLVQVEGYGPLAEKEDNSVLRLRDGVLSRRRTVQKPCRALGLMQDVIERRAKVNQIAPQLIEPVVRRGVREQEGVCYWRHDVKLQSQSLYRMSYAHADEIKRHIVCPQIVVLGNSGFGHLQEIQKDDQGDVQFERIDGGHHCHLQSPIRVSDLIFGLVNKI